MRTSTPGRPTSPGRLLAYLLSLGLLLGVLVAVSPSRDLGSGIERTEYLPVEPSRLAAGAVIAAGATLELGIDDVPHAATGAVLSVTGTRAKAGTTVAVCGADDDPCPSLAVPTTSVTASTFLVADLGGAPTGSLRLVNGPGEVAVFVDLVGFVVPSRHVAPADQRVPADVGDAVDLGPRDERAITLPSVPRGATAVVLDVVAGGATSRTSVTACPLQEEPQDCPPASSVGVGPGGQGKAVVVLPLSPTTPGEIVLANESGDVTVTVGVHAFLVPGSPTQPAGYVMPVEPRTIAEEAALAVGAPRTLSIGAAAPAGAVGAVVGLTASGGEEDALLAACPGPGAARACARPGAVPAAAGRPASGFVTVPLGGPEGDLFSVYTTNDLPEVAVSLDGWVVGSVALGTGTGETLGWLDRADARTRGIDVSGWAIDPGSSKPVYVTILLDGRPRRLTADLQRPDVARTYPEFGGAHGFRAMLEAAPGPHQVCATAGAVAGGEERVLGCRDVVVPEAPRADVPESAPPPDASSTGVLPGTTLTRYEGDLVITEPGTVIQNLDVHGTVVVLADDVVIRNSRIRGRPATSKTALLSNELGATNLLVTDTEIAPDEPSPHLYGVIGSGFTLERVDIHHVLDSVHIYGPNVTIRSSWLRDNVHYEKDPNFGGTPSHDDGVQIQSGHDIRIVGSRIEGAFNAAIMITQDVGVTRDVELVGNWIDGGGCSVNVADKGRGAMRDIKISGNRFGRGTRNDDCAIIAPRSAGVQAWNNHFTDGGFARVRNGL